MAQFNDDDCFMIGSNFDSIRADHHKRRVSWLGKDGKSFKEISSQNSEYLNQPSNHSPSTHIKYDLKHGFIERVHPAFPYQHGEKILRKDLHKLLGGSVQGGICPSKKGSILLFSDPKVSEEFGYHDGWSDSCFLYFGSGQEGDMEFSKDNKALLNHKEEGRKIHLFMGSKGEVTYENEFILDPANPYELIENQDKNGEDRIAIVFRLKPANKYSSSLPQTNVEIHEQTVVEDSDVEVYGTKTFETRGVSHGKGERTESKLMAKYILFREKNNLSKLTSKIIKIQGDSKNQMLKVDGWIEDEQMLIEAKSKCTRNQIRLAIGQLYDYKRFVNPKKMVLLVPNKPKKDLIKLLHSLKINVIFQSDGGLFEELNSISKC